MNKLIVKLLILCVFTSLTSCKKEVETAKIPSQFYADSIYSNSLSEYRKHNVYLPENFDETKSYPIIYETDGNEYLEHSFSKKVLDSLISHQIIKPTICISSYCNREVIYRDIAMRVTGDGKKSYLNYRNFEYVDNNITKEEDSLLYNRFENHMTYFSEELIPSVENKLKQKVSKKDRIFYGVSNGAGFGTSLINKKPDLIGTYLCFSTFGGDLSKDVWKENVNYGKLYLKYGTEEPFFLEEEAKLIQAKFKTLGQFCDVEEFVGGHDNYIWNDKFTTTISKILNTTN